MKKVMYCLLLLLSAPFLGAAEENDPIERGNRPYFVVGGEGYAGRRAPSLSEMRKEREALSREVRTRYGRLTKAEQQSLHQKYPYLTPEPKDSVAAQVSSADELRYIEYQLEMMGRFDQRMRGMALDDPYSRAFISGLVGPGGQRFVDQVPVTNWQDALTGGLIFKSAEVISKKLQKTLEKEGGEVWDAMIASPLHTTKEFFLWAWYQVVHAGLRPYNVNRLSMWKEEVLKVVLEKLQSLATAAEKAQGRGTDVRARNLVAALAPESEEQELQIHASLEDKDPIWSMVAQGYAQDFDRICRNLEMHRIFYNNLSDQNTEVIDIVAMTERLQASLQLLKKEIILAAAKFKDVVAGDNKQILEKLTLDVTHRFDLLTRAVQMYHGLTREEAKGIESKKEKSSVDSLTYGGLA